MRHQPPRADFQANFDFLDKGESAKKKRRAMCLSKGFDDNLPRIRLFRRVLPPGPGKKKTSLKFSQGCVCVLP